MQTAVLKSTLQAMHMNDCQHDKTKSYSRIDKRITV